MASTHTPSPPSGSSIPHKPVRMLYPLFEAVFGLFLGLTIFKFGNPIILNARIDPPQSLGEWITQPWPIPWAYPLIVLLGVAAIVVRQSLPSPQPQTRWLSRTFGRCFTIVPIAWFVWQCIVTPTAVDSELARTTLPHLGIVLGCYLIGLHVLGRLPITGWIWLGPALALALCVVRATNQRLFEFPRDRAYLIEGDAKGWKDTPKTDLIDLAKLGLLIETNQVLRANPIILAKMEKARVHGTLVYPNALANLILLLAPPLALLAWSHRARLRPGLRPLAGTLALGLTIATFFWTDSKAGWLVALAIVAAAGLRFLPWSSSKKLATVIALLVIGTSLFAWRFAGYFEAGATSASARFDYWRAAIQTTWEKPILGTGPGTFQRPYARLKDPEAEMTRLVHNDYLEQFSDSGILGGLLYLAWIGSILVVLWWPAHKPNIGTYGRAPEPISPNFHAVALGLSAWFLHGIFEFSLYIPALAWTAFTFAGMAVAQRLQTHPFSTRE